MHGQDRMAELQLPCAGEKREKSLHRQGSPGRAAGAGCASCAGEQRGDAWLWHCPCSAMLGSSNQGNEVLHYYSIFILFLSLQEKLS